MKCSICNKKEIVNKNPPLCKKCYNKQYKRKVGVCNRCNKIKKLHTKELCDLCYRKSYSPPKKKCRICGKINTIKSNFICEKCYQNKDFCFICNKYKEVCTRNLNKPLCRNCYNKYKRKYDKEFGIVLKLRQRLYIALKKYSKNGKIKTSDEYGINYESIIEHLKPFPEDIEKYNIDHIFPLSAFNFNNQLHIKAAFDPENHQWLSKEENFIKNAKYDKGKFFHYLNKKIKEYEN